MNMHNIRDEKNINYEENKMDKTIILNFLKEHKQELHQKFGLKK